MAELCFDCLLDHIQCSESIPLDMFSSNEGLCLRHICFMLLQHSLNMQQVSLTYLKSLIGISTFQPKGYKDDMYSSSTAILLVFLSNDQHKTIKFVHISLVVHHMGSNITTQADILLFVGPIESDLGKARDRWTCGKSPGDPHSYLLLVGNYGGTMALTTEPPYCLMYPTIYDAETEDQTHFNTSISPSGMHTEVCICHSLLQLMDRDPTRRREFEGSNMIVLCCHSIEASFLR